MTQTTIKDAFYALCCDLDSPRSLGYWIAYNHAPNELARATINPLDYSDPVSFGIDYACLSFLRKYKGLETGIDLAGEALSKFGNSERKCEATNRDLQVAAVTGRLARTDSAILQRIRNLIAAVWGKPEFSSLFSHCGWGPGSTSTLKGGRATREDKMSQFPVSITPGAVPYFSQVIKHDHLWLRHLLKADVGGPVTLLPNCFKLTQSSRLLTVPKDSRSDRTICAEPTGNIYLQKGVGTYLRKRLKRFGVDLDSQLLNQELARMAHVRGLSTLDLASASDTISIGVVRLLCPPCMFELLNCIRTPSYRVSGSEHRFHKFSSMGNGFTFELESLIFWAIAKAITEEHAPGEPVGIYGDDIICSRRCAHLVVHTLEDLGFSVNTEKSFIDGRFFESCGKHYFDGYDVTPFYQKSIVASDELELMRFANRVFDWLIRMDSQFSGFYRKYGRIHNVILRTAPSHLKAFKGFWWLEGDGFFRTRHDPGLKYDLNHGFTLRYLAERPSRGRLADGGLYADEIRLASMGETRCNSQPTNGFVVPRKRGKNVVVKRVRRVQLFGRTVSYDSV